MRETTFSISKATQLTNKPLVLLFYKKPKMPKLNAIITLFLYIVNYTDYNLFTCRKITISNNYWKMLVDNT